MKSRPLPDLDIFVALEPEELGLLLLPILEGWGPKCQMELGQVTKRLIEELPDVAKHARKYEIREAIEEAWAWLEGQALLIRDHRFDNLVFKLSRRARRIAEQPDIRHALAGRKIPKDSLHPAIRESVWSLYHRAQYEEAITAAMKAVEVQVRASAGFTNADYGQPMIARAFHAESGPLRDESAGLSERQALCALMTGAYGLYRNPYAHRLMGQEDPDEAAEIIMLANHMLRIIDVRIAAKTGATPREE